MNLAVEDDAKLQQDNLLQAKKILLQAILEEKNGNYDESCRFYKQCYKLFPRLDLYTTEAIEIEGLYYDHSGNEFRAHSDLTIDCQV
jgi:hypothetical protein